VELQRSDRLRERLGATHGEARADAGLRAEGQEGLLRIERGIVALEGQCAHARDAHRDLGAAHGDGVERGVGKLGIGLQQALDDRQRRREGVEVDRGVMVDDGGLRGVDVQVELQQVVVERSAHRQRPDPAGRPGEVGIEGRGQAGRIDARRQAGEPQLELHVAIAFCHAQHGRGNREAHGRGRQSRAAERRPVRRGGGSGAPRPSAELATGANSSRCPSRTMLASRATRAGADHGGMRGGEQLLDLGRVLARGEQLRGGPISTGAAPFLSSKTRCARSGFGPRGVKPSARCIW